MNAIQPSTRNRTPWNKGKLFGPKAPFKPKDVWTIRLQLQQHHRTRELALLILGIDSKLRSCAPRDTEGARHLARRKDRSSRHHPTEEDRTAGPV